MADMVVMLALSSGTVRTSFPSQSLGNTRILAIFVLTTLQNIGTSGWEDYLSAMTNDVALLEVALVHHIIIVQLSNND